jgi:DNA repair protein RadB
MAEKMQVPEPLHSLLGGIEFSALTNFYGAPGTGKTNICLLLVLQCIKNGGKVVYIDTEGGFSPERLAQLSGDVKLDDVMKKINLFEPKNFKEQGDVIRGLDKKEADLIIVDSAAALYRLEYADPEKEALPANRELSRQMSILSTLARKKNIPVIVTGHTYRNWDTDRHEIVGGDSVKYWSKVLVFLERTGKMAERNATVMKHRSLPEGKSVKFMITHDGIKPASGFRLF